MRVQVLSPDGAQYLSYAKQRVLALAELRTSLRVPALEQTLFLGAFIIYLRATEDENLVRISGGGADHILLLGSASIYGFNWDTLKLEKRLSTDGGFLQQGGIVGGVELFPTKHLTAGKQTVHATSVPALAALSTPIARQGLTFSGDGDGFRANNTPISGAIPDRELTGVGYSNNLPAAITLDTVQAWNDTDGPELWSVPVSNPVNTQSSHRWAPRIFFPDIGNLAPLPPARGLFYGRHLPLGDEGHILSFEPATEIRVRFGGYFEDRTLDVGNGLTNEVRQGYCEVVQKITEESGNVLTPNTAYFIPELWQAPRSYIYQWNTATKFVGCSLQGSMPKELFLIDYTATVPDVQDVVWWSAQGPQYPDETTTRHPLHGIMARNGETWALHRYRGFVELVAQGVEYIGHSVSTNGSYVAVFTGAEVITTCTVYDLGTGLVKATKVLSASLALASGQIIPVKPLSLVVPQTLPEEPAVLENLGTLQDSALGGISALLSTLTSSDATMRTWKIITTDRQAIASLFTDVCWASASVTLLHPDDADNALSLVTDYSCSIDGVEYAATGWGPFIATLPYKVWEVNDIGMHKEAGLATWSAGLPSAITVVAGSHVVVTEYRRKEEIDLTVDATGTPSYSGNAVDPIEWTPTPDYEFTWTDGIPILNNGPGCADITLSVSDACGLSGEFTAEKADTGTLTITGPTTNVDVGSDFSISGGLAPYEWLIDDGDIDQSGVITERGCAAATITVTDVCGTIATLEITYVSATILVTGPLTGVTVNDQFTAMGGTGDISWSAEGLSIDSTGKVTALDSCVPGVPRVALITATDDCGVIDVLEVLLVGGVWGNSVQCTNRAVNACGVAVGTSYAYSGKYRYEDYWAWQAYQSSGTVSCSSYYCRLDEPGAGGLTNIGKCNNTSPPSGYAYPTCTFSRPSGTSCNTNTLVHCMMVTQSYRTEWICP